MVEDVGRQPAHDLQRHSRLLEDFEAGQIDVDPVESPARIDCSNGKTFAVRAHEKGLELVCDVAPDVPDQLVGDSHRLAQIVVNLIGNAVKLRRR